MLVYGYLYNLVLAVVKPGIPVSDADSSSFYSDLSAYIGQEMQLRDLSSTQRKQHKWYYACDSHYNTP